MFHADNEVKADFKHMVLINTDNDNETLIARLELKEIDSSKKYINPIIDEINKKECIKIQGDEPSELEFLKAPLTNDDPEFQKIKSLFDETMKGKYKTLDIIKLYNNRTHYFFMTPATSVLYTGDDALPLHAALPI